LRATAGSACSGFQRLGIGQATKGMAQVQAAYGKQAADGMAHVECSCFLTNIAILFM